MRTHAIRLATTIIMAGLAIGGPAAHAHTSYHAAARQPRNHHPPSAAALRLAASHETVSFESDSFTLTPEAMRSLDRFARQLKPAAHEVRIEAVGYADATGTNPHNLLLAERRATAVLHYLHTRGVSLLRMSAVSYGEGMPQMSNHTPDGRAANRRVVIAVLPWRGGARVA
jgi:outer membrane protein OmpA-like peptidoglycan-associated protein